MKISDKQMHQPLYEQQIKVKELKNALRHENFLGGC